MRHEVEMCRPESPCNAVCTLDDDNRCIGCARTLEEISRWALMSARGQWALIDKLTARRRRYGG